MTYYIGKPKEGTEFSEVVNKGGFSEQLNITFGASKVLQLADCETYRLLLSNTTIAQDGCYGKDVDHTVARHLYIDLHLDPYTIMAWWKGKDSNDKYQFEERVPQLGETYILNELLKERVAKSSLEEELDRTFKLADGFMGAMTLGPNGQTIDLVLDLEEDNPKRAEVLGSILRVEETEQLTDLNALKVPEDRSKGRGGKGNYKTEAQKADERLQWLIKKLEDTESVKQTQETLTQLGISEAKAIELTFEAFKTCVG